MYLTPYLGTERKVAYDWLNRLGVENMLEGITEATVLIGGAFAAFVVTRVAPFRLRRVP